MLEPGRSSPGDFHLLGPGPSSGAPVLIVFVGPAAPRRPSPHQIRPPAARFLAGLREARPSARARPGRRGHHDPGLRGRDPARRPRREARSARRQWTREIEPRHDSMTRMPVTRRAAGPREPPGPVYAACQRRPGRRHRRTAHWPGVRRRVLARAARDYCARPASALAHARPLSKRPKHYRPAARNPRRLGRARMQSQGPRTAGGAGRQAALWGPVRPQLLRAAGLKPRASGGRSRTASAAPMPAARPGTEN